MTQTTKTAEYITQHMHSLGPQARVLLVAATKKALNDEENGIIAGENGVLTLYSPEYSSVRREYQITHKFGGIILVTHMERIGNDLMRGSIFSLVVFDNVDISTNTHMFDDAMMQLRIPPAECVTSVDGYITDIKRPEHTKH